MEWHEGMTTAELRAWIKEQVATWPRLTEEQRNRLAVLFRSSRTPRREVKL